MTAVSGIDYTTPGPDLSTVTASANLVNGTVVNVTTSDGSVINGTVSLVNGTLMAANGSVAIDGCVVVEGTDTSGQVPPVPVEEDEDEPPTLPDRNTCFLPPEVLAVYVCCHK